jgi:hypothetical protein
MFSDFAIVQQRNSKLMAWDFFVEVERDGLGYSVQRLKTSEPLGFSIVAGIKRSSAAIVVFGWWFLFILQKVVGAAISG